MIFNLNFYVLIPSESLYGLPGPTSLSSLVSVLRRSQYKLYLPVN